MREAETNLAEALVERGSEVRGKENESGLELLWSGWAEREREKEAKKKKKKESDETETAMLEIEREKNRVWFGLNLAKSGGESGRVGLYLYRKRREQGMGAEVEREGKPRNKETPKEAKY